MRRSRRLMLAKLVVGAVALHAACVRQPVAIFAALHIEGMRMAIVAMQRTVALRVTVLAARMLEHPIDLEKSLRRRTFVPGAGQGENGQQ